MSEPSGYIYLIACNSPLSVKIGYTRKDPRIRLQQLQTGCPSRLVLLGWFPGDRADELAYHAELAEHRLTGEWFAVNERSSPKLVNPLTIMRINNRVYGYEPEPVCI
ncbi:GIY-YIG nuclease family protein [Sphingomonas baiyangensis]|uniref:GIY-YIG nuclease family protein n=1 Tax=Sphingomonas baiyangensis TaxID=2572576 RepID=A0A4U1L103_9SPHN|nr:GIY-YIG nuclease family protein [Sphingomonas baiyangensis]TKD50204.1 GIY-YIG nuclease family protein [Sphingomonas baiyangensis]